MSFHHASFTLSGNLWSPDPAPFILVTSVLIVSCGGCAVSSVTFRTRPAAGSEPRWEEFRCGALVCTLWCPFLACVRPACHHPMLIIGRAAQERLCFCGKDVEGASQSFPMRPSLGQSCMVPPQPSTLNLLPSLLPPRRTQLSLRPSAPPANAHPAFLLAPSRFLPLFFPLPPSSSSLASA